MTQAKPLQDLDILIQQISDATGLASAQISEQLEQASIPSFQFSDAILVSPEDLDPIIDAWAASIKEQLLGSSGSRKSPKPARTKTTDKSSGESSTLAWPDGYEALVTHLYTPTLKKVLPTDADQRQQFIDAINGGTADGERLVNELATTIVKRSKRKLAFDKVLSGLKGKIADL